LTHFPNLQQQFSHKRAESFDFCKSTATSTPKSQLIDRAKTPTATGIKSNPVNPGMSPVLRKNIVMASQFRSNFNFRSPNFPDNFHFPHFQRPALDSDAAFEQTLGSPASTTSLSTFRQTSSPKRNGVTATAAIPPLHHRA
jgi:hypothetical protein